MHLDRREFLKRTGAAMAIGTITKIVSNATEAQAAPDSLPIVDTHVHVWDLKHFRLPWLDHAGPVLNRTYAVEDYQKAIEGLNVRRAVYVEVSVTPEQREAEAKDVIALCDAAKTPIRVAVIGGTPGAAGFREYITKFKDSPFVRGVRSGYQRGQFRDRRFVDDIRLLGELGLSFDLLLDSSLVAESAELVAACPETHFILDHCGNASPAWFGPDSGKDRERRERWEKGITALAVHPNVYCKISGVAESAPKGQASAERIAPVVNHCLDQFGHDRVMFAGNWPVCLNEVTLKQWVQIVQKISAPRGQAFQRKLFAENATRWYRLPS